MTERHYHRLEDAGASLRVLIVRHPLFFTIWTWMSDRALLLTDERFNRWFQHLILPIRKTGMPIHLRDEGPDFNNSYLVTF